MVYNVSFKSMILSLSPAIYDNPSAPTQTYRKMARKCNNYLQLDLFSHLLKIPIMNYLCSTKRKKRIPITRFTVMFRRFLRKMLEQVDGGRLRVLRKSSGQVTFYERRKGKKKLDQNFILYRKNQLKQDTDLE